MLRRILDSPWTYFALAGALVLGAVASQFELQIPSRPKGSFADLRALKDRDDVNVVFILIDTLRADHLGSYGYERPTSPVMDQLVSRGIRFADVESQSSWTKCSMASIWTAVNPPRTGVTRFFHALPADALLPAERLQAAGFRTAGLWRNGWVAPNFGFSRGFDDYVRPQASAGARAVEKHRPGQVIGGTDEDVTQAATEFLRTWGHKRFLLYLHYMDVHQYAYDQQAADLGFGTEHRDAYDGAIHWVDRNVGAVLAELERRDLFEKTLVVIASDHGEAFFEHSTEGHARNLYPEVVRVPLLIIPPVILDHEIVVQSPVRNVDIWPTILDLVGVEPLPDVDGVSLVPLIEAAARGAEDPSPLDPRIAFLDQHWGQTNLEASPLIALEREGRRVMLKPGTSPEVVQAYDHASDPMEQNNLAAAEDPPGWIAPLKAEAEAYAAQPERWGQAPQVEIDEMYREQLKALGYVIQ